MLARLAVMFFVVMFLAGCATTADKSKSTEVQQLQDRISSLEEELAEKDQQISRLEDKAWRGQAPASREFTQKSGSSEKLSAKQIQTALRNAGYYQGAVDGKIGPMTKKAIKEFQGAKGLEQDGVVGKRTSAALRGYLE
ncbi:MAG: peptidoglycan-binding domain-containing protein [Candidatus Omnitrophota bacterium]